MRSIKMVLFSTLSVLLICIVAVTLMNLKIYGKVISLNYNDFKYFIPVLTLFPMSHFIWGRYITQKFEIEKFDNENWNRVVIKYNAIELLNDETRKVYKIPFYKFYFPSKINIEIKESEILITAPNRLLYDFKKDQLKIV